MAKKMKLGETQKQFLCEHLRGTGKFITQSEAKKVYGITQLPARMSELRMLGLNVKTTKTDKETAYMITARDIFGSRAHIDV